MDAVPLRILRLDPDVPLPRRMTEQSAGFDLHAAAGVVLMPGDVALIACGFAMALPPNYEAQIRPRSGLASRHRVTLVNSPGTVDADYRGEVRVPLINLGAVPFEVSAHMRVAQMVVQKLPIVELVEVGVLDGTRRGSGGFGSTSL